MSKMLLIMRHAKSDWDNPSLLDFDRPLNKRGNMDAINMGQFLRGGGYIPDLIICSPAIRAKQTTEHIINLLPDQTKIETFNSLYPGDCFTLMKKIEQLNDKLNVVMIVGHNPIMEEFVSKLLVNDACLGITMSTSNIVGIELSVNSWKDIRCLPNKLIFFISPKLIKSIT